MYTGNTPLFLATLQNNDQIVRDLLVFCPDLRLPDVQGEFKHLYIISSQFFFEVSKLQEQFVSFEDGNFLIYKWMRELRSVRTTHKKGYRDIG